MRIIHAVGHFAYPVLFFVFLAVFCAGAVLAAEEAAPLKDTSVSGPVESSAPSPAVENKPDVPAAAASPAGQSKNDEESFDDEMEQGPTIADPLEGFNRAMYQFNDKLYFWLLKPVAQGYSEVVPEPARISVKNFFSNLAFPIRLLSCLLQGDFNGAVTETGRFGVNTIWGIGGLMDPAADKELDLQNQDSDLGLVLASYGVGHGFYLVWPLLGPSSPRDSVNLVGNYFIYPMSYVSPWYWGAGVKGLDVINATSLRIGDYEAMQQAAIDPYIAMRDGYVQYRLKKIKAQNTKSDSNKTGPQ